MSLMKQLALFGFLSVPLTACSGAPSANTPQPAYTTICALSMGGKEMNGAVVRLKATYSTDLRHGAFLTDPQCELVSVEQGADAADVDPSVPQFDKAVKGNILDRKARRFAVDISGKFAWSAGDTLHGLPSATPNGTIPSHGVITIEKVWSYERLRRKDEVEAQP